MKNAIKKAIEGGWNSNWLALYSTAAGLPQYIHKTIREESLFWQAIGKAMGWDNPYKCVCATHGNIVQRNPVFLADCICCHRSALGWNIAWHRFIDHLAEGKDADSFFQELLK